MADVFLRIFVSGRSDLPDERTAAFDAIIEGGHDPDRYEDWPAFSQRPLEASIAAVKRNDILVLLLGTTYGLLADTGRSITHEEYLAAQEQKIPVLAFRVGSGDPEPKQSEFIAYVQLHQTIRPAASIDALKSEIKRALSAEVARGYREQRDAQVDAQIRTGGISVDRRMAITIDAQAEVIDSLQNALTSHASDKLNAARTAFREGRPNDAIATLDELISEKAWHQIDRGVRARTLSTLASFRLATDSTTEKAEPLLQEAKRLDPEADYSYFDALQHLYGDDPEHVLESLSVVRNIRALNLRAALLLELERIDEAADLIEHPPDGISGDVETERLHAFVSLARGDAETSIRILDVAIKREPHSYDLRVAFAIAKIASTIVPPERPTQPGPWLPPIDPTFVATSSDMLARLDEAATILGEVIDETQWTGMPLEQARSWRLAALALHPERRDAARTFAHQLLELDPADSAALVWSNAFGFGVDVDKAEITLSTLPPLSASRVIAVVAAMEHTNDFDRAESLLTRHRVVFDDEPDLWHFWQARLLIDKGKLAEVEALIPKIHRSELRQTCELMLSESHAKATADWDDFVRLSDRVDPGYRPLAIRARLGRWSDIVDQAVLLAEQTPSPASVSLAATALFHVRRNSESLAILDRYQNIWSRSLNAIQLQRLHLRNQIVLGHLPKALKSAEQLFQKTNSPSDLITTIHAAISAGRWKDARFWASRLFEIDPDKVSAANMLQIAQMVMIEDRDLARDLWKRATTKGVANELLPMALHMAMTLGLAGEATELTQSAMATGVLRQATPEEFATVQNELKATIAPAIQEYARGETPLVALLAATGRPLIDLFDKQLSMGDEGGIGSVQPLYIRHGGRMLSHRLSLEGVTNLTLDVSTILLADALGVLDAVEERFVSLRISPVTCAALAEQETRLHAAMAMSADDVEKQRLERLATRLSKLATRIGAGLSSGRYVAFGTAGSVVDEEADLDLTSQALADFFLAKDQQNHAFVVDDRFANSHLTLHGSNIVTLLHVLAAVRESGHLGDDDYFGILLRLRRANFRFIDLEGDEIVHWLTQANWNDGALQESEPLRMMRFYINSALSDRNLRVIPLPQSTPDRAFGEGPFAMNSSFAPVRALLTLWSLTDFTIEQRTAMSDWILHNLYTGSYGVQHLYGKGFSAARDLMLNDVAGLLTMFFDLDPKIGRAFSEWVQSRIFLHRLDADPDLYPDLITAIKQDLLQMLKLEADDDVCRLAIRAVFSVLPSGIRKEITSDTEFTTTVQLRGRASIQIAGFEFLENDFWKAIARLRTRASVTLKTTTGEPIHASRAPGDAGLYFDLGKQRCFFPDETFVALASKNDDGIRNHLRAHPENFDVDDQALDAAIRELLALRTLRARSERYRKWTASSAAAQYADLRQLLGQANHTFSDLMPEPDALLRHYLPGYASGTDLDAVAAFAPLIDRADLLDVLRRAIVMPIAIPNEVLARFTAETATRRTQILTELRAEAGSPVARAHVAVLGFSSATEADRQLAVTMIDELAGSNAAAKETKLFMTVVRFVYWRLSRSASLSDAVRLLLAWAHAGRLLGIFVATTSDVDQLQASFIAAGLSYPDDYLTRTASSRDLLHPFTATGLRTVAASLAHVATVVSAKNDALDVAKRLASLIYRNGVGIPSPFLRDTALGTNICQSFLDSDLSEPLVDIDKTGAALLTSIAQGEILTRAMQKIDDDSGSETAWRHFQAIIGNLPPPANVRRWLEEFVQGSKLEAVAASDVAMEAFTALSDLQTHFSDEYRGRVEDQAVAAATHWQQREHDAKSIEEYANRWAFIAMALAARPGSREDTGSALGRIYRRFINVSPDIAPMLSTFLSRMPFQLPMEYLLPLWPAVIAVRAIPFETPRTTQEH